MKKLFVAIAAMMLMTAFVLSCTKQDNIIKVTPIAPSGITSNSATCGGEVDFLTDDFMVTEMGVCWGKSKNPTVNDNHMVYEGRGERVVCTITGLEPNTTYHVRVYATDGTDCHYGADQSFKTLEEGGNGGGGSFEIGYVDLGLPSGALWSNCNMNAYTDFDDGGYYAWGEIDEKGEYNWATYKHCRGKEHKLIRYCSDPEYGLNGFVDYWYNLAGDDDVAYMNWQRPWHIPSVYEWNELKDNTTATWTSKEGYYGLELTGKNGNSIFLPATGFKQGTSQSDQGVGYYWSSELFSPEPTFALAFYFEGEDSRIIEDYRYIGMVVRPVMDKKK